MIYVTFLIAAHNRREVLLGTLRQLQHCSLAPETFETILVDNASTDGTADAVASGFPEVTLIRERVNRGACAKNAGLPRARGRYVVFLDDDSYPLPGSVARMIQHFKADPSLGAAIFDVTLPDGSRECSAYPNVFIGCGTGFRKRALAQVGGLPEDFFMQAEEYDLSLRLLAAGWDVRRFDDLHVAHLKTPTARRSTRTTRLDVRNNLTLIARYFPDRWVMPFAVDWTNRYAMLAAARGHRMAHWQGFVEGAIRAVKGIDRRPLGDEAFERFARIDSIAHRLRQARDEMGLRTILLADLGKNVLAYWLAAEACGLNVIAVSDDTLGGRGWRYRGVPIVTNEEARRPPYAPFDAVVISNLSPVHAALRRDGWRRVQRGPVLDLFEEGGGVVEWLGGGVSAAPSLHDSTTPPPHHSPPPTSVAAPAASGSRRTAARSA
ncbi:MAG: glycosyltransferase [Tepidisphaeraceae bacterium]